MNEKLLSKVKSHFDKKVEILIAKEVGSRAFDLHSSESDHDVYVVFRQPTHRYANVNMYKENLHQVEVMENWEVQGWNIKRFGELAYESNPTIIEFLNSDLTHYSMNDEIEKSFKEFGDYAINNANLIGLYYHYCSLSKKNYEKYILKGWDTQEREISNSEWSEYLGSDYPKPKIINEYSSEDESYLKFGDNRISIKEAENQGLVRQTTTEQTVKRNLFVIRGITCAKWVKNNISVPPLQFPKLLNKQDFIPEDIEKEIWELIELKRKGINNPVGNKFGRYVEDELKYELDNSKYNTGSLEKSRVNELITESIKL